MHAILIWVPSHAHPAPYDAHVTTAAEKHSPFAAHAAVSKNPHSSFGAQSASVEHAVWEPPESVPESFAMPASSPVQGPVCKSGLDAYPAGKPVQATLISVPSHAQPMLYAWQTAPGAGKHCPVAAQARLSGKPQISFDVQSVSDIHALPPVPPSVEPEPLDEPELLEPVEPPELPELVEPTEPPELLEPSPTLPPSPVVAMNVSGTHAARPLRPNVESQRSKW